MAPKTPSRPTSSQQTAPVTREDPAIDAAAEEERLALRRRQGRAGAILNQGGAAGLGDTGAPVERKALLGQ